ncbi:hypothetical protein N7G274_008038 [Stereocaulon virgatum]|uniref:Cytochrome P450 n=1 Tax=Stereocaulon virgatum TaxID=373712 RepID=A0ABR4A1R1_9LECA
MAKEQEGEQPWGNEYAGIEPGNLNWGHGRFSCPGQWYASAMFKSLRTTLLLAYDFELTGNQICEATEYNCWCEGAPGYGTRDFTREKATMNKVREHLLGWR